ncbi:hypothetical protein E3T54_09235 [Cryobacterium sp. Sr8]|uniref:peptidoglycan DD-metalloendopeptidase family protein n=1 Tax=Cryobacterium sp. Sr8 TaxID=1259203 RepID=UPI001100E591|nr:peptidoglycan DD-metalloendopeptidase family protein [Cryobacterium sp. Sr8]TFD77256.1 hypothetical protein E3T54_09235 [Cryobacterium sp. Sr8]
MRYWRHAGLSCSGAPNHPYPEDGLTIVMLQQPNGIPQRLPGVGMSRRMGFPIAVVLAVSLVVFGAPAMASAADSAPDPAPTAASDPAISDPAISDPAVVPTTPDLSGADPTAPLVDAAPVPAPVTDTPPVVEPDPSGDPGPGGEPDPGTDPEPVADPAPSGNPTPTVDPEPTVEPAVDPEPTVDPGADPDPAGEPDPDPAPGTPNAPAPPAPPSPPTPAAEVDPIPQQVNRPSASLLAERAAAAAAARAEAERAAQEQAAAARTAAERAAAYAAALAEVASAQAAYDAAKLGYASAKAEFDAALARVDLVHALAEEAAATADASKRVLAALIRSLAQHQSGTATADVLLGAQNGADLLYQLGTLDKLAQLTGSIDAIRARSEADTLRALSLSEQEATAQQTVQNVPIAETLTAMQAAEAALQAATARLTLLSVSAPVGMSGLTPIANTLAAMPAGRPTAQGWVTPAVGSINDVFGPRPTRPVPGVGAVHYGTDIGASCGAAIYAANSGVVVAVGSVGTYGNWILIDHGNGVETGYAHVAPGQTLVAVGDAVIAGEVIAGVGSTGASTGCHLHFEVRVNGSRVDGQAYLAERGVVLGR